MDEREHIIALTQIAFLNAIILSFLSIQFLIPVAFMLLLWIVPTIFALETFHSPLRLILLSGLIVIFSSFILFGIGTGLWAMVYISVGGIMGLARKRHFHWTVRFLSTSLAFAFSLFIVMVIFAGLAQISWPEIKSILDGINLLSQLPLVTAMVVGSITWMVILAILVDWFLSRVLQQLQLTE